MYLVSCQLWFDLMLEAGTTNSWPKVSQLQLLLTPVPVQCEVWGVRCYPRKADASLRRALKV